MDIRQRTLIVLVIVVALFLVFVPGVPQPRPIHSNCVFCPADLGIDYASVTYMLFGIGVYHTV